MTIHLPATLASVAQRRLSIAAIGFFVLLSCLACRASDVHALASNNVPLDHWSYAALDKLSGFGLIHSDLNGIRPYTRIEMARLVNEALGEKEGRKDLHLPPLIDYFLERFKREFAEELAIYGRGHGGSDAKLVVTPVEEAQARYAFVDGKPRDFVNFRNGVGQYSKRFSGIVATEGTPLLHNNEGIVYGNGSNLSLQFASSFRLWDVFSGYIEPILVVRENGTGGRSLAVLSNDQSGGTLGGRDHVEVDLLKGYAKFSPWNVEFEAGRDSLWWGQGSRGSLVLSDNAPPLDMIKFSNPTPTILPWYLSYIGLVKYSIFIARLEDDRDFSHANLGGVTMVIKPHPLFEIGVNATALFGGKNRPGDFSNTDVTDTLASFNARLRLPFLRNAQLYAEYGGEDSPGKGARWYEFPFQDVAYLVGIYFPAIFSDGRTDLRIEYSNNAFSHDIDHQGIWYGHSVYRSGYTFEQMILGHSMGPDAMDLFTRATHYLRNNLSVGLDYEHMERGLTAGLVEERSNGFGADVTWDLNDHWRVVLRYGFETISNFNMVAGDNRQNQLLITTLKYTF